MQLTLVRTTRSILYFIGVLMIISICAAIGVQLIYGNYRDEWQIIEGDFGGVQCVKQPDALENTVTTLKTLFWHLYGYGSTDDADLIVRSNFSARLGQDDATFLCDQAVSQEDKYVKLRQIASDHNMTYDKVLEEKKHQPTEFLGYTIVFTYDLVAIVVLLNILVAMMNTTYGVIVGNSHAEWKFSKGISRWRRV